MDGSSGDRSEEVQPIKRFISITFIQPTLTDLGHDFDDDDDVRCRLHGPMDKRKLWAKTWTKDLRGTE